MKSRKLMKKLSIILALALAISVFAAVPALAADYGSQNSTIGVTGAYANYDLYSDVTATDDHWAYEGVMYCTGMGIVNGVGDGKFNPDGTLTRAEFITMIGRAIYEDEVQAQTVDADNWYSAYVRYLETAGVLEGIATDDNSISEGMPRQEIAQILFAVAGGSAAEIDENALADVTDADEIDSSFLDAVKYCYGNGYITGYNDGSFKPENTVTRAEAAVVIQRAIDTNKTSDVLYFDKSVMNVCFAPEGMEANIYSIYTEDVRETILRCGEMAVNNINYTGSGELVFSVSDPSLVNIGSDDGTMYMLQTGTVIVTCTAVDEGISTSYVLNMVDTSDDNVTKIPQDLTNYY